MNEIEVKTEIGSVKYKRPNVPQKLRLLSKLGVSFTEESSEISFETLADIIEHIDNLIVSVNINVDGRKVSTWEQCVEDEACMNIILQVATQIVMPSETPKQKVKKTRVKKS